MKKFKISIIQCGKKVPDTFEIEAKDKQHAWQRARGLYQNCLVKVSLAGLPGMLTVERITT